MSDLSDLRDQMRVFTDEREWGKFHDPKSLILALMGEVGELAELFQWLPAAEAADLATEPRLQARVGEEMADVLVYLVRLADILGVDLSVAANAKIAASRSRFAVEVVRGTAPVKE